MNLIVKYRRCVTKAIEFDGRASVVEYNVSVTEKSQLPKSDKITNSQGQENKSEEMRILLERVLTTDIFLKLFLITEYIVLSTAFKWQKKAAILVFSRNTWDKI